MNIVDTSLWIEYFSGRLVNESVKNVAEDKVNLIVPTICIYELYKKSLIEHGETRAKTIVGIMQNGTNVVNLDEEIAKTAAMFSKEHKLPMADSVIYATAKTYNAIIWTQDKHFEGLNSVKYFSKTRKH
ncbi:MAG: type II toxin-antitoxin system VapC family toxin [Chitinivibrionia bacterium]|nr:type II toxin-antitoxin system VapC family toxin [Chitinivibrionia bacterium]